MATYVNECQSVKKKEGGRTHLVAGEWVAVVLVAYQALLGRVELGGVSGQVRVLLVRSYEEKRCILARCDTVRRDRSALALAKKGGGGERDDTDSNTSMPISG